MEEIYNEIVQLIGAYVPNLLGAVAILVIGWLAALSIAAIVRGIIRKTSLDKKIAGWIAEEEKADQLPVAKYISKTVYYLLLLFVLVAFFQALGLTLITQPLNSLLTQIFSFAPQLLAAAALLLLAWVLAHLLRMLITKVLEAFKLDERLADKVKAEEQERLPVSKTIANAVYWLIFLLFLPAVLGALQLEGLLGPVQGMMNEILTFLPNIFTSGLIILVGWFLASIIRRIVSSLFSAIGADSLSAKIGLTNILGKQKFSEVLGLLVYILILIPIIISALEALSLQSITAPATDMLNLILSALPNIFAAVVIIAVSYIVGKVVASLVSRLLSGLGFNSVWIKLGLAREEAKDKKTPSEFVGYLVLLTILFFASIESLRMLNFDNVANMVTEFTTFAGSILMGLIIFAVGLFLANLIAQKIRESKAAQAGMLAVLTRTAILVLVGAMALQQMGFAQEIVITAFGICLGAVAIAFAVAFGIGGRDIAARQIEEWFGKYKS